MSWLQRFFGQDTPVDTPPVETHEPGEYKVHINTTAEGGNKFGVRAIVYRWDTGWFMNPPTYQWRIEKMWDWTCTLENLDKTEAGALEYAQQYIENTRRNDRKVINIK